MSKKINKSLILNEIKLHYGFKNDAEFARFLEIKPQTLASWHSRNTFDIDLLFAKCVEIDGNYMLSGCGEISRTENKNSEIEKYKNLLKERAEMIDLQRKYIKNLEDQLKQDKIHPETIATIRAVAEDPAELKK